MQGKRRDDVYQDAEGWSKTPDEVQPGDYWKLIHNGDNDSAVEWYCCVPSGWLGNLSDHEVTENEDRTITVSPSILTSAPELSPRYWHGYLEHGIWREI